MKLHLFVIRRAARVGAILLILVFVAMSQVQAQQLSDGKATAATRALYENLFRIREKGFMFGHQDTDAYGVGWRATPGQSDVKLVTGSYPAVHGWDLGKVGGQLNLDSVEFSSMNKWIIETYKRGGVNTVSWHIENPLTGESSWSKGDAVRESLPGGKAHAKFLQHLEYAAEFLNKCEYKGVKIPIIFRPFHEHNGDWFWWGKGICSEADYIALWQFTVSYLRDTKKLHHMIYAFSPDRSRLDIENFTQSYLYAYPGDEWVDIIGYDNYWDVGSPYNKASAEVRAADLVEGLIGLTRVAAEKKKVAVLSETGQEMLTDTDWYTRVILGPVVKNKDISIAYMLVWRNHRKQHHYAPYPGHPAADDFVKFYRDPNTIFESDLQNMYTKNKPLLRK